MVNPCGTGSPILVISARFAPFPPISSDMDMSPSAKATTKGAVEASVLTVSDMVSSRKILTGSGWVSVGAVLVHLPNVYWTVGDLGVTMVPMLSGACQTNDRVFPSGRGRRPAAKQGPMALCCDGPGRRW